MENQYILSPFYLDESLEELSALTNKDWIINSPALSGEDKQTRMSVIYRALARRVKETVKTGMRPVSIAGDCCSAIGVLAGLQRAQINPTLIWFDAHGDFNTLETTPSGFLGGMPLAMIVGKGDQTMPNAVKLNSLPENRVILCDARDLDPGESELVSKSKVVHIADAEHLLDYPLPPGPLWVHLDTDILPAEEAPAMNYPVHGGSPSSVVESVFNRLAQTNRVIAFSLSSWNPKLDTDGKSRKVCMDLLRALVGF